MLLHRYNVLLQVESRDISSMELCSNQPSPSSSAKAGRKPCFTRMEEVTLVEEYNKRRDLLEGKVFSKITLSRKRELWGEIACILNSMNPSIKRSTEEVRKKYKNIVQSAKRKRNASCRHQTEGGPTIPLSVAEDQIIRDMEGRLSRPSSSVETGLYFVMQENLASEEGSVPPDEMLTDENTGKNESNKSVTARSIQIHKKTNLRNL
ncbi:myb-related transcription factor, partner of profilin-like [Lingula anatina]|uniref:Myb-related transcription factor, partner of profilin-like n=1 Tax=Lingula anatina TaxID=7574 RepID=A0A1S3HE49_LINAN|nr:myb-related transcription factor, partner of profilin-like [Lingula anatina]|eukprot:XP_013383344.1 myb-related transcription factor, partner of profilin-like [Lingula anatina]